MTLARLINRKRLVVLGLNSGTSADGLDLATLKVARGRHGLKAVFLIGSHKKYPPDVRKLILQSADSRQISWDRLVHLDNLLGQFFGRTAAAFIRRLAKMNIAVDLIASHGQTVHHLPHKTMLAGFAVHGTMQLGLPEQIAAHTGRVVVADFRQADIAQGGEGAPVTVAAMAELFAHKKVPRLVLNIGGMANYFYFPAARTGGRIRAADCGPGNSLCDLLSQKLFDEPFDRNGQKARSGTVCRELLTRLQGNPFFADNTVSTGRETFGADMVRRMTTFGRKRKLSYEDIMATAAELTAVSIVGRIKPIIRGDRNLRKLYLTGGGARNRFFRQRIAELSDDLEIANIGELGIESDLVEAAAFAVMGESCMHGMATVTRFDRVVPQTAKPVLGRIVQPPKRN